MVFYAQAAQVAAILVKGGEKRMKEQGDVKSEVKEKEAIRGDFKKHGLEPLYVDELASLGRLERFDNGFSLAIFRETVEEKTCKTMEVDIVSLVYFYEGGILCFNRYDEHEITPTPISKASKLGFTNLFFDRGFGTLCFVADRGELTEIIKFHKDGKIEEEDKRR